MINKAVSSHRLISQLPSPAKKNPQNCSYSNKSHNQIGVSGEGRIGRKLVETGGKIRRKDEVT